MNMHVIESRKSLLLFLTQAIISLAANMFRSHLGSVSLSEVRLDECGPVAEQRVPPFLGVKRIHHERL